MFKQIVTLFRGAVHDEAEAFTDRNALKILNQQIRDGALVVERARNALALAMAQGKKEAEQLERLRKRIGEMEAGAVTALETGKAELARLRDRQHRIDLTDRAMEEIDVSGDPCVIAEKLAAAGCTPQRRASADDVLERLKAKAEPKAGKA
ncbi:MAG: PspA/IM30 family protein [Rhodobiaceae bacterium]|nr:PspA/IM30 family protein [Rhodobiaceae bacterium]MCC0053553.1 PspA/IM30 family protein [Rhodobiaceae bacterium]